MDYINNFGISKWALIEWSRLLVGIVDVVKSPALSIFVIFLLIFLLILTLPKDFLFFSIVCILILFVVEYVLLFVIFYY